MGAALLIVVDHFRRGLAHLNLGGHLLDLRSLLFELGCESLYLFLLLRDRCFQLLNSANFAIGGQNSIVIGNKAYNNGRGRQGYAGFNARINPTRGASASHSIFIGNSSYDQDYGYKEQASGLSDIKQIGNDYNRNRRGPAKSFSAGGQMTISPEMKNKLKALTEDADMPDSARRVVREYLSR